MVFYEKNKFFHNAPLLIVKHLKTYFIFLLFFVSATTTAQIEVGGNLVEDETWFKDSTYIVIQDLFVVNQAVLTIEPGVTIQINRSRGIIVEDGSLLVNGTSTDSVRFKPNYNYPGQNWKWKGLIINNADTLNKSHVSHACFNNAETAIEITKSQNVIIENTCIFNSLNVGVHFVNSSFCSLSNSIIEDNYDGIEIFAGLFSKSSNNEISNCVIRNQNHNIIIYREEGGICRNNIISNNIIKNGNDGIWALNNGGHASSGNVIQYNRIINNGNEIGYGLFLSQDSSLVKNNIFWGNNIAVFSEAGANNSVFSNNSFYQNNEAVVIGQGSEGNYYFNNTFASNKRKLLTIDETRGILFRNNNLMYNQGIENIVVNRSANNISMVVNYWDTFNTVEIDELIYDHSNDADLGKVVYVPFKTELDTSNPIAPPDHAIKQIVNNKLRFSWRPNKEADLKAYNIYFGDYENYGFSEIIENFTDTSFTFASGFGLEDKVAVTAVDSAYTGENSQLFGHESPLAFARIYPFAGDDDIACGVEEYDILNANIPFEYQYIFWTTNGDGLFKNPYSLTPTYIPGEGDFQNESVFLSMNVVTEDDLYFDGFKLTLLDEPIVFAGNDTVVLFDEVLYLQAANAKNFDELVWTTIGDGYFDNDTIIKPTYYPGSSDVESGVAFLVMTAYSECGLTSDTLRLDIAPYFSVEGKVWADNEYQESAIVVAFSQSGSDTRAVQTTKVSTEGFYSFPKLPKANYYLYAVPDTSNAENLIPGYYANKYRWQIAYLLEVKANVFDADIYLPSADFVLPEGEASISGHFVKPEKSFFSSGVYCSSWFEDSNNEFCNGGASNVTILLFNYNKSKLLAYTLTDEFGNFYFNNLPYGNYVVDAEKAGMESIASSLIQLSPDHKNEDGVVLEISGKKIGITFDQQSSAEAEIAVFPNPVIAEVNIPYSDQFAYNSNIVVFNHFGQMVIDQKLPEDNTTGLIKLNTESLPKGLFFGQIINSGKIATFRFAK